MFVNECKVFAVLVFISFVLPKGASAECGGTGTRAIPLSEVRKDGLRKLGFNYFAL
ncbi:hypothetical protein [Peribacillus sp. NPDC096448]|uniref:hypothetical protein n=1 Tax=Peribacillus sp. NPDC096448 TaxID=3364395 RepID=UPI00380B5CAF